MAAVNALIILFLMGIFWEEKPRPALDAIIRTNPEPAIPELKVRAPLDTPDQCTLKEMKGRRR
jgi:hypothetical protein